jgi:hypothetical protein
MPHFGFQWLKLESNKDTLIHHLKQSTFLDVNLCKIIWCFKRFNNNENKTRWKCFKIFKMDKLTNLDG